MAKRTIARVRALAMGGLLLTSLVFLAIANAQEAVPQDTPSIAFMNEAELSVDLDWLVDQDGRLPIRIRNNTIETQTVELSLEGFVPRSSSEDVTLNQLLIEGDRQDLKPGEVKELALTFKPDRPAGTDELELKDIFTQDPAYPGVVVATSFPGGDIIRREFELKAKGEKLEQKTAITLEDLPRDLETLTFLGTNYLPSILNPLFPAVFWFLVAILFSLGWLFFLREQNQWVVMTVSVVAVMVVALLVHRLILEIGTGPEWGRVIVNPIRVPASSDSEEPDLVMHGDLAQDTSTTPGEPVGVTAVEDRIATAIRYADRLEVVGITRAGRYEGKIDLSPADDDETKTVFAVNVADWWPFAFLTIALGVVVGYQLTRFYNQGRAEKQYRARYNKLWHEAASNESLFLEKYSGRPQAGYSIMPLFPHWIRERIEANIKAGEFDAAKETLDNMESYIDQFAVFLRKLDNVYSLRSTLEQQFDKYYAVPGKHEITDVPVYTKADEVLHGKCFIPPNYTPQSEDIVETTLDFSADNCALKATANGADGVVCLLELLTATLADIEGWIARAEKIKKAAVDPTKKAQLQKLIDTLKGCGKQALREREAAKIEIARRQASTKYYEEAVKLIPDVGRAVKKGIQLAQKPSIPTISPIDCLVSTPDGQSLSRDHRCIGDPDDLLTFSTSISVPARVSHGLQVRWYFQRVGTDPITSEWIQLDTTRELKTQHCFGKGGSYHVGIQLGKPNGDVVGLGKPLVVHIQPEQGRWSRNLVEYQLTEQQMTIVSGILAVSTGMLALYSPSWGSPRDYLAAFLWGSLVSETTKAGAKVVASLAQRKWPLGS